MRAFSGRAPLEAPLVGECGTGGNRGVGFGAKTFAQASNSGRLRFVGKTPAPAAQDLVSLGRENARATKGESMSPDAIRLLGLLPRS